MGTQLADYLKLIEQFLTGSMRAQEFTLTFMNRFKKEEQMDEPLFEVLDELFGDADSFTIDPELLNKNPTFYLDEASLREKAQLAAVRLSSLRR